MSSSKSRDAFYTKPEIAHKFVSKVNSLYKLEEFDLVLEPSAGSGAILSLLPPCNREGLDIHPMHKDVITQDFFEYKHPGGQTAVVGNPPFGKQSKLAIEFFNKAAEFADVIAFIIPRSWKKYRTQKRLHDDFELYSSIILPDAAFTLDGEDYKVRCAAQIWSKYAPTGDGSVGYETWNDSVSQETLDDIDTYQRKHGCYDKT